MAPSQAARRARHLVAEIDVAGGVDQVQFVRLAVGVLVVDRDRVHLDGDAPFALQVHVVQELGRNSRSFGLMVPVLSRNWSARVLLPWSMWAMIEKLRITGFQNFLLVDRLRGEEAGDKKLYHSLPPIVHVYGRDGKLAKTLEGKEALEGLDKLVKELLEKK
jgi:hypothetical protein